jgi:hypothetical protein
MMMTVLLGYSAWDANPVILAPLRYDDDHQQGASLFILQMALGKGSVLYHNIS